MEVHHEGLVFELVEDREGVEGKMGGDEVVVVAGEAVAEGLADALPALNKGGFAGGKGGDSSLGGGGDVMGACNESMNIHTGFGQVVTAVIVETIQPTGLFWEPAHANLEGFHEVASSK